MGNTMYYLPRELQQLDLIFGEDVLSKFTTSLPIEMYIESSDGWEGQSELVSKFGLEIRNSITIKVSVARWDTEVKKIKSKMWVSARPQEGDLIYDVITKKIFEIKFVDQDEQFHQLGRRTYAYKLKCEMFQYGNEKITTGITSVDTEINKFISDLLDNQLLNEDNSLLLQENGDSLLISDAPAASPLDRLFDTTSTFKADSKLIEFSMDNPFGD
jgi:hypothetical protein